MGPAKTATATALKAVHPADAAAKAAEADAKKIAGDPKKKKEEKAAAAKVAANKRKVATTANTK